MENRSLDLDRQLRIDLLKDGLVDRGGLVIQLAGCKAPPRAQEAVEGLLQELPLPHRGRSNL